MTNIIEVNFGDSTVVKLKEQFQYNKGMMLKFEDIELENTYQVHFSNSEDGESYEMIGDSEGVEIPREVFKNGTKIFAYLYLHPTEDSSITAYEVIIPIKKRSDLPSEDGTTSQLSNIDQAILALNEGVAQSESNVEHYPTINEDGYWCTWDAETETFVSTGFKAEGVDGEDGENGIVINLTPTAVGIETSNGSVIDDTTVDVSLWGYDGVDRANVVINNAPVITGASEVTFTTDSAYGVTQASFTMQEGADLSSPVSITFDCYINGLYLPRTITLIPVAVCEDGADGEDARLFTFSTPCIIIPTDSNGYTTAEMTKSFDLVFQNMDYRSSYSIQGSGITVSYKKSLDDDMWYGLWGAWASNVIYRGGSGTLANKTISATLPIYSHLTGSGNLDYTVTIDGTTYTASIPWVAIPTL